MAETRFIVSQEISLYVEELGAGPAILFGHGMYCNGRMFDLVAPRFGGTHRVIRLDFPGHGQSGIRSAEMTLDALADNYLAVLDALGVARVVLVGFSMGGMAALRFALAHPERLAGLAVLNSSADAQSFREKQALRILAAVTRKLGVHPAAVRSAVRMMFSSAFIHSHPQTVQLWENGLVAMSPETIASVTRMVAERESISKRLPCIRTPALVITSAADTAIPIRCSRALARGLPDARLRVLADAGHATPLERPDEVTDALYAFLAEIEH